MLFKKIKQGGELNMKEMAELEFLSGQFETMESFVELYGAMLQEAKAMKDRKPRQARAKALQSVMMKQTEFLMNAWLKEKQAMPLLNYGMLN